ncbi:MAG: hypothetical protein C4548_02285 [Desulfobacteraceae bacterium]|nr:MAG: hypothetical protein C4548_02285 [Desulfobacteraceae bacterium]
MRLDEEIVNAFKATGRG